MHHTTPDESQDHDLGFGSLGQGRSTRLVNRDGSFTARRTGRGWRATLSVYHTLLTASWPRFLGIAALAYFGFNLLFALAYWSCGPDALSGPELDSPLFRAFAFSVQTSSTIGYGQLAPASTAANVVVMTQAFVSLVMIALGTGVVFARFSRPMPDFVWSEHAVVAPYRGIEGLMMRLAYRRENAVVDLQARVILGLFDADEGSPGPRRRQFHALDLEREGVSFLPTSWTIVHPIEGDSPLRGLGAEELRARHAEVIVLLRGNDATSSQTIFDWCSYTADEIVVGARFRRIAEGEDGPDGVRLDVRRIHEIEPTEGEAG